MNHTAEATSPATALRTLALGDAWEYRVTGSLTPADGDPRPVSGIIAVSVMPDTLSHTPGGLMLVFRQTLQALHPDGARALPAPAWMFAFVQDAGTGDAAIVADNMGPDGGRRLAESPQVFYPGRWSADTRYANRLQFGASDFVRNTLAVVGQELVETTAGTYLSWVAEITSESPAMGRVTGTDWWTPELGAPARFETGSTMPDGAALLLRATLTGTTVMPDARHARPRVT